MLIIKRHYEAHLKKEISADQQMGNEWGSVAYQPSSNLKDDHNLPKRMKFPVFQKGPHFTYISVMFLRQ